VGLAVAGLLAVGAFALAATAPVGSVEVGGSTAWSSDEPLGSGAGGAVANGGSVVVDVQGAVVRPGVQRLAGGARVADAIAAAGGYGRRVDAARAAAELNLAAPVKDGDRIIVPARGDPGPSTAGGGPGGGGGSGGGLVDLNSATANELDALRDRKIVGAATFEKLQSLVTVR
jgi:competence protein ComEA